MYSYLGPLLDDGLQFQVRSSCSVLSGISSLYYVDYDTTLSQLSFNISVLRFQVRSSCMLRSVWNLKFAVRRLRHYVEPIVVHHWCSTVSSSWFPVPRQGFRHSPYCKRRKAGCGTGNEAKFVVYVARLYPIWSFK